MKKKKEREKNTFFVEYLLPVLFPLLVLAFWQLLSNRQLINPVLLPSPSRILSAFESMLAGGDLARHMQMSGYRVISGFLLGSAGGLILGVFVGLFHKVDRATTVIVNILRPIPMIALIPLFIIWLGIDEASKIAVITVGSFWCVFMNTIYGVKSVDNKLIEIGYVLKKSRLEILLKIVLPSALPSIFAGIRLGAGNAWACVVAAEMIAASSGIGFLVMFAREISQTDIMMVGILMIGLFGLFIDYLL
ncbi:MAG TPA: ABC transporter permease, partial [Anaerovoracaceae bacterium]|nr:ABC transporter permease [Anaerovoracaceae bacterium]